jgi:hypothetical protein
MATNQGYNTSSERLVAEPPAAMRQDGKGFGLPPAKQDAI